MTTIEIKTNTKTLFVNLEPGTQFDFHGTRYIKLRHDLLEQLEDDLNTELRVNAVDLKTGGASTFSDGSTVQRTTDRTTFGDLKVGDLFVLEGDPRIWRRIHIPSVCINAEQVDDCRRPATFATSASVRRVTKLIAEVE